MSHLTVEQRVEKESKYQRAAAAWVANKTGQDVNKIYGVDFALIYGGYCETCGYETAGLEYYYNGKLQEYESLTYISAGQFIQECMELLEQNN